MQKQTFEQLNWTTSRLQDKKEQQTTGVVSVEGQQMNLLCLSQ
jgi:hypothetical protein